MEIFIKRQAPEKSNLILIIYGTEEIQHLTQHIKLNLESELQKSLRGSSKFKNNVNFDNKKLLL